MTKEAIDKCSLTMITKTIMKIKTRKATNQSQVKTMKKIRKKPSRKANCPNL